MASLNFAGVRSIRILVGMIFNRSEFRPVLLEKSCRSHPPARLRLAICPTCSPIHHTISVLTEHFIIFICLIWSDYSYYIRAKGADMQCERCGKEHDGSYATGRFCGKSCACRTPHPAETKARIASRVRDWLVAHPQPNKPIRYTCAKCGDEFERITKIKNGRLIHCDQCKQRSIKSVVNSILELSPVTIHRMLKRANQSCYNCGWNVCVCDIHHIVPRGQHGTDAHSNLTVLCPNCHRMAHCGMIDLRGKSIDILFTNWRDYYGVRKKSHPRQGK